MKIKPYLMAALSSGICFGGISAHAADTPLAIQRIQTNLPTVIPRPMSFTQNQAEKAFLLSASTQITAGEGLENEVKSLQKILDDAFVRSDKATANTIVLAIQPSLQKEAYKIEISGGKIAITGGDSSGVFYGIQTLRQLMPVHLAYGKIAKKATGAEIAAVTIEDKPLTHWRGVMVDSARHFQPKEAILKFIDLMSVHKLNRMHWHLVDSEGWRLEIKKHPKLTEVCQDFPASYPSEDPTDKSRRAVYQYGHFHGGGYYTQDDIREIVAYAKERHVEIMPEIEFPGHAMAMFTAYPEFSVTGKVPTVRSNISPDLINLDEKSLNFLRDILDETMALFPFEMIHFGGDEAPKGQWKNSAEIQQKMKDLGLKDEEQLQAWLFNQMAEHIAKQGRRPAGWEEIMHGENMEHLTKSAAIMPWLSVNNGVKSANNGYGVIHTSVGPFYLDSWQTDSPADNWALYKGPLTLSGLYHFNLFPNGLTEEGAKNIWGAQCQLWSELMPLPEHMEYQAYPRLTALSELTWTQPEAKDYQHYYKRLLFHTKRLDALKVNYRYVDPLPIATWDKDAAKDEMLVSVPLDDLSESAESVAVELRSTNNRPLSVSKVEVLNNGKVISTDEHTGKTDSKGVDNAYLVTLPANSAAKNLSLRIQYEPNAGSNGEVRIFRDRGLELFKPRNFAGGDFPTAVWKKSDMTSGKHTVRIQMDGLVQQAGEYELIFKLKESDSTVFVGKLHIAGADGKVSESGDIGKFQKSGDLVILPITVPAKAIKPGNSLFFSVKSDKPSEGEARLRALNQWPSSESGQWEWSPESLQPGNSATYIRDVKALRNGVLDLNFRYTGGANGLDISSVQLVHNGKVAVEDTHKGFTGGNSKDNDYSLKSPAIKAGNSYQLRLAVSGAGGTNSNGILTVK